MRLPFSSSLLLGVGRNEVGNSMGLILEARSPLLFQFQRVRPRVFSWLGSVLSSKRKWSQRKEMVRNAWSDKPGSQRLFR